VGHLDNDSMDIAVEGIRLVESGQKWPERMVCGFAGREYLGYFGNPLSEILAEEKRVLRLRMRARM
jgi:hypothetical protein